MKRFPCVMFARATVLAVMTVAVACDNKPPPTPAFAFNRPEHLEFVCINPTGGPKSEPGNEPSPVVLPLKCCANQTPLAPNAFFVANDRKNCGSGEPSLHALVTQSTRGEVAAVDLAARKVLDSDQRIPGYTFVDVGGLPTAIVAPSHRPGNENEGPLWTYVTSGEEQSLRAVATCRFRAGAECGPELQAGFDADRLKRALPAPPRDMVIAKDALWITLPDISALAKIELPTDADNQDPFASEITYFRLPVVDAIEPAAPAYEAAEYFSVCGLGYEVTREGLEATRVALPVSESAPGLGKASPTRMRFYEFGSATDELDENLLLVADASQPVIHALSIEADGLQVRGSIATGAPIRDFALTPAVPALAADPRAFVKQTVKGKAVDPKPNFDPDEPRYLYAIDDRDGSVMVQSFAYSEGTLSSTPLLLPATRERSDRLPLGSPATAIDIADNRNLTDDLVCDWGRDATINKDLPKAKSVRDAIGERLKKAQAALDDATSTTREALTKRRDKEQADYNNAAQKFNALDVERKVLDSASPNQLRGVFALITTLGGRMAVVDVHDLDVYCRGERWCKDSVALAEDDAKAYGGVAVRRHTLRITNLPKLKDLDVSETTAFAPVVPEDLELGEMCEVGRYAAALRGSESINGAPPMGPAEDAGPEDSGTPDSGMDEVDGGNDDMTDAGMPDAPAEEPGDEGSEEDVLVCNAADPWLLANAGWSATWEGLVLVSYGARLSKAASRASVVLNAPPGMDLCARGIVDSESEVEGAYDGDLVVFVGAPPSYAPADCEAPDRDDAPELTVQRAFKDRLELVGSAKEIAKLLRCYPDSIFFNVRANDRYLIVPTLTAPNPLHRLIADDTNDGRCVADPSKDARYRSRAKRGETFENIYTSFALREESKVAPDRENPIQVAVPSASTLFPPIELTSGESLPVTVRYLRETGDVYVVDVAQGLRRFIIAPEFQIDTNSFR